MSVNEKKWLVMHMHVQLKLDEVAAALWGLQYGFVRLGWLCMPMLSQEGAAAAMSRWVLYCSTVGEVV